MGRSEREHLKVTRWMIYWLFEDDCEEILYCGGKAGPDERRKK